MTMEKLKKHYRRTRHLIHIQRKIMVKKFKKGVDMFIFFMFKRILIV